MGPDSGFRRALGVFALMLGGFACEQPLAAQTVSAIRGRLVDGTTSQPVRFAVVRLFDSAGTQIAADASNAEGEFQVDFSGRDGRLLLTVETLFHQRLAIDSLPGRGIIALGDIRLEPDPVALDEVTVEVRRRGLLRGREWARRNQLLGKGTFLPGAVVALAAGASLGEYIAGQTRLWVRFDDRGRPTLHNPAGALSRCVDVLVNRWRLERTGFLSVDEIPREQIAAIEIYENERDLPPGYWFDVRPGCGLVNIWMWNSW